MRIVWTLAALAAIFGIAGGALHLYTTLRVREWEQAYPPSGKAIEVDGTALHYVDAGQGRPVILLHGGILSSIDFTEVVSIAAGRGFRAIAFDRPGYGHSQRPAGKVTPVAQARLIHQAAEALKLDKPILVAHSYSGSIAMAYALEYAIEALMLD